MATAARRSTKLASAAYVASGILQPLLMVQLKRSGLAHPKAQPYMFFYYLGPALLAFRVPFGGRATTTEEEEGEQTPTAASRRSSQQRPHRQQKRQRLLRPPFSSEYSRSKRNLIAKACAIAVIDAAAQCLNYGGAALAGPTIYSVVYSSLVIWVAFFRRLVLPCQPPLTRLQAAAVSLVVCGLLVTSFDSATSYGRRPEEGERNNGRGQHDDDDDVAKGTGMVFVGSVVSSLSYVFSEAVMLKKKKTTVGSANSVVTTTNGHRDDDEKTTGTTVINDSSTESYFVAHSSPDGRRRQPTLSVAENAAIQGTTSCLLLLAYQLAYTVPRFDAVIAQPMRLANTTAGRAFRLLAAFTATNFAHTYAFYVLLRYAPGGATTAGMMKGLQASFVSAATHLAYCNRGDGNGTLDREMCFSYPKFVSLVAVVTGVTLFGFGGRRAKATTTTTSFLSPSASEKEKQDEALLLGSPGLLMQSHEKERLSAVEHAHAL